LINLIEQIPTGVQGLDNMLRGGFPENRTILVLGGPGTGKTILGVQFLMEGIEHGENGLYVSLDEKKNHLYAEMAAFGWRLSDAEAQGVFGFLDFSRPSNKGKKESLEKFASELRREVLRLSAKRIVVDPITALVIRYPDAVRRRNACVGLIEALNDLGTTNMVTLELRSTGLSRSVQLEEYLAHGVIVLQTVRAGKSLIKTLQVEKMRGIDHDDQPRPYSITGQGIEVYSEEVVF